MELRDLMTAIRKLCQKIYQNDKFEKAIMALIVINAIIFGIETYDISHQTMGILKNIDNIILLIFVFEIFIRIAAEGKSFFGENWNRFDLIIVLISSIPTQGQLSVIRVLRVLRTLRIISTFPNLQRMVESMFRSVNGVVAIGVLLCIVSYVFAIMASLLFSSSVSGEYYFGNLGRSLFSLFQIMTLESWSDGIARQIIEDHGWGAALFFVVFIISTSFTFLNMFIAVFTNTMAAVDIDDDDGEGFSKILVELKDEIQKLKTEVKKLSK
jgi:voltage-gated sodium channel